MKASIRRLLPLLLIACGLLMAGAYFLQPVRLLADGQEIRLRGLYLTAGDALRGAGLALGASDQVSPAPGELIPPSGIVLLDSAHTVGLWSDGKTSSFETVERIPANWLAQAGLTLYPGDRVLLDGVEIDPLGAVSGSGPFALQFLNARPLRLSIDGQPRVIYSQARTLGEALWQAGLELHSGDRISHPADAQLATLEGESIELRRARAVVIESAGRELSVQTAAQSVGEALREAGLAPQGLDTTLPGEEKAVPPSGRIQLVRGREVVALAEELLPYETSYTTTDQLELDQQQVIQPGQYGVVLSRERVRYADGVEVSRAQDGQWTAAEARDQVVGLGTQAVVRTLDTGAGSIEYYRAVTMYATSYSPCQLGIDGCSSATASGMPLQKGVVAVTRAWYNLFAGAQVFIPGYGLAVIGDLGGGIPGRYWIDLGYSDEDYEAWHQNVTVYFLTPVPPNVPAILP